LSANVVSHGQPIRDYIYPHLKSNNWPLSTCIQDSFTQRQFSKFKTPRRSEMQLRLLYPGTAFSLEATPCDRWHSNRVINGGSGSFSSCNKLVLGHFYNVWDTLKYVILVSNVYRHQRSCAYGRWNCQLPQIS
jgi:hypothetical protein